jgi:hypothetical protein
MKLPKLSSPAALGLSPRSRQAYTLVELLFSSLISLLVLAGLMGFMYYSARSISGVVSQTQINQQAWMAAQLIFERVRVATSVSNDASGNVLTIAMDDDPTADLDRDGKPYNDKGHYEQFRFDNGDGNDLTITNNSLIYLPDTAAPGNARRLVPSGLRKLPSQKFFTITNQSTVRINYALVDAYTGDSQQAVDVHLIAVPRNRPATTNVITILP